MSDDFVRDLELALTAAARRRAAHPRRRFALRLPPLRRIATAALAVALLAGLVAGAAALIRGGDPDRSATPPPGTSLPLPALLEPGSCPGLDVADAPAAASVPGIGLFASPQGEDDALEAPPEGSVTWLPVRSFDRAETRRAGAIVAFPTLGVPDGRSCGTDRGPGVCLVLVGVSRFRCFTAAEVAAGSAVLATGDGSVVGILRDGVDRVTLEADGKRVTADVIANVYEARFDVPAGTSLTVSPAPPGCARALAPTLVDRLPILGRPAEPGHPLPRAARELVREWGWQLDAALVDEARFWGGGDEAEFWVVPIVPAGAADCAPATGACLMVVTSDNRGDAHCVWGKDASVGGTWKLAPLFPDRAVLLGLADDGTTAAEVTIDGERAQVDARDGFVAGVLPFPYRDGAGLDVEYLPRPTVAVIDATGGNRDAADALLDDVRAAGYPAADEIAPGNKAQPASELYWHRDRASRYEADLLAQRLGIQDVTRIDDPARTPRPVLQADADLVVVTGAR